MTSPTATARSRHRPIAHIHPDYATVAMPSITLPSPSPSSYPILRWCLRLAQAGHTDFAAHITKAISAKRTSWCLVWGGDYVALYKQALGYGLFEKMKFASMIAFGVAPHAIGKDHPEGSSAASIPTTTSTIRRPIVGRSTPPSSRNTSTLERISELPIRRSLYGVILIKSRHRTCQQIGWWVARR